MVSHHWLWIEGPMSEFPEQLISGYRAFAQQRLPTEQSRYRELSERGQSPEVMVIGCCDSRVSPEVVFDAGPGELFVVRTWRISCRLMRRTARRMASQPRWNSRCRCCASSISWCWAMPSAAASRLWFRTPAPLSPGDFIGKWMSILETTRDETEMHDHDTQDEFHRPAGKARSLDSLKNLMTFPASAFWPNAASCNCMALTSAWRRDRCRFWIARQANSKKFEALS